VASGIASVPAWLPTASQQVCASADRPAAAALTHKNHMRAELKPGVCFPFYISLLGISRERTPNHSIGLCMNRISFAL